MEGYRTPQEATVALKAAAGTKGANAIINLSQQRSGAGRSTSQGALQEYQTFLLYTVAVLLALALLQRLARRARRARKPAPLHPKLQAYAGRAAADVEADREAAAKIVATSSTGSVAGYEIVQQIEAVFVEGYRTPQEATVALKAAAGTKGANAIINLSQQRSGAGRSTSQGDAVIIRPTVASEKKK